MELPFPQYRIPQLCDWVSVHQDNYGEEGPQDEWTNFYWYCCTQQQVLARYTLDEWGHQYGREEAQQKICSCRKNRNRDIKLTYRMVQRRLRNTGSQTIILGQNLIGPMAFSHFYECYQQGKFTDYQIRAGSKTFPVHRLFLSLLSPLFQQVFQSDFKESPREYLLDEPPHRLEQFLDQVYSGSDFSQLPDLIQLDMIDLALHLEIDLPTVQNWIFGWDLESCFGETFQSEMYEKYRKILLSLPGEWPPYILADKIGQVKFPQDYSWDENLDEGYHQVRTQVKTYSNYVSTLKPNSRFW